MWILLVVVPIALYIVVQAFTLHSIVGIVAFIMLVPLMLGLIFDIIDPNEYSDEWE